jgi:hypothetical protein
MADALNVPVAVIQKNAREEIRVSLSEFKGTQFADVRIFAEFAGPSNVRGPTRQGVSIAIPRLPELANALLQAVAKARELGLIEVAA